jgi:alanyl-tRNA synthetase
MWIQVWALSVWCAYCKAKSSNYDTDVFQPIDTSLSCGKSGKTYNSKAKPGRYRLDYSRGYARNADHIRAVSFAIADGQLPSSNKAGYVIRRILRRAVRYSYQTLGFKEPFLINWFLYWLNSLKAYFDEPLCSEDFVQKVVLEEEASFLRTLQIGIKSYLK